MRRTRRRKSKLWKRKRLRGRERRMRRGEINDDDQATSTTVVGVQPIRKQ